MKSVFFKQLLIVLVSTIGLYSTGGHLMKMGYIETLSDGLNVFIFFTSFFPFIFVAFAVITKIFKTIYKFTF